MRPAWPEATSARTRGRASHWRSERLALGFYIEGEGAGLAPAGLHRACASVRSHPRLSVC